MWRAAVNIRILKLFLIDRWGWESECTKGLVFYNHFRELKLLSAIVKQLIAKTQLFDTILREHHAIIKIFVHFCTESVS